MSRGALAEVLSRAAEGAPLSAEDAFALGELGDGDVPIDRALSSLQPGSALDRRSPPTISLEWERAWDPELAPAEVALPRAHAWLVEHVGRGT
jgi:hypothetical protein